MADVRVVVLGPTGRLQFDVRVGDRDMAAALGFELLRSVPGRSVSLEEPGTPDEYLVLGVRALSVQGVIGSKDPFQRGCVRSMNQSHISKGS